ncbi:MAG: 50S ribosomal protein L15 [Bacteroidales bacterium]|nr:50S ribosomal protein L15 [Bacteroidales bacterium]
MDLSNLKPANGSTHHDKRLGRGEGSGRGGTSTRGHKGAKARSGYKQKFGFEGGQMPLQRRLPKFGFKCPNRVEYKAINVSTLQAIAEKKGIDEINIQVLRECGMTSKNDLVKILADGELKAKLTVKAHAFSKKAIEAIQAVGGTAEVVNNKKAEAAENK